MESGDRAEPVVQVRLKADEFLEDPKIAKAVEQKVEEELYHKTKRIIEKAKQEKLAQPDREKLRDTLTKLAVAHLARLVHRHMADQEVYMFLHETAKEQEDSCGDGMTKRLDLEGFSRQAVEALNKRIVGRKVPLARRLTEMDASTFVSRLPLLIKP